MARGALKQQRVLELIFLEGCTAQVGQCIYDGVTLYFIYIQ